MRKQYLHHSNISEPIRTDPNISIKLFLYLHRLTQRQSGKSCYRLKRKYQYNSIQLFSNIQSSILFPFLVDNINIFSFKILYIYDVVQMQTGFLRFFWRKLNKSEQILHLICPRFGLCPEEAYSVLESGACECLSILFLMYIFSLRPSISFRELRFSW